MGALAMLLCMRNFSADRPILDDQSEDSYIEWLDRKKQDDKEPWLFYGEDEDFINAAWLSVGRWIQWSLLINVLR